MRICFVGKGSLRAFAKDCEECGDLCLFGFNGMGEVAYEQELKGETEFFEEGARLSKKGKNVVVCGCTTNARGHRRRSAFVAENGRILGISDKLHAVDGECGSGAELRIYPTKIGKMGVAVGGDIHFFEDMQALALCGADFIVCPYPKVEGELPLILLRADAFRLGVPIFLCGEGYVAVVGERGEIAFSSPQSPVYFDYVPEREYHLIERRKCGYCPKE